MTQGQLLLHSFSTHHIHKHTLHEHYALSAIFTQKLNPWLHKIGLSPMIPRLQSPHFKNEKIFKLRESDLQCLHCKLNCTACADVTDGFRAWNAEETSRKGFSTFLLVRILNKQAIDKVLSTSLFLLDPSPIIGYVCHSLPNSFTDSPPFSKLDWCDLGVWRCLLKTCWGCYNVTVADVSDEDRTGNSLLRIWKLRFGHKA